MRTVFLEILIVLATIGSWAHMFVGGGEGILSKRGLASLKYYTCLSNIFAGLVSCVTIIALPFIGLSGQLPMWLARLKYAAAVSVGLTFLVVIVFLGPRMGYKPLFSKEQLFLHAVGPILAVVSFLTSPMVPELGRSAAFAAVVPTLIYGVFYMGNILKNGIGEGEKTNDWYGFAIGGVKYMPIVFAVILLATCGLAAGLLGLRGLAVG